MRGMPRTILFSGSLCSPSLGSPIPVTPTDEQRWQQGPLCVPSRHCSRFPGTGGGAEMGPAAADLQPAVQPAQPVWAGLPPRTHTPGPPAPTPGPPAPTSGPTASTRGAPEPTTRPTARPGRCLSPLCPLLTGADGASLQSLLLLPHAEYMRGLCLGWGARRASLHPQSHFLVLQEEAESANSPWCSSPAFSRIFFPEPRW